MITHAFSVDNIVAIYGDLLSSINTIWHIYVIVYLGSIGWLIVRARELSLPQKILTTITITVFSLVIIFYFYDAYTDLGRLMVDLKEIIKSKSMSVTENGFFSHVLKFNHQKRFLFSAEVVSGLWLLLSYIVWFPGTWKHSSRNS